MTTREDAFAATIAKAPADPLGSTVAATESARTMDNVSLSSTTRPAVLPRPESGRLPEDTGERYAKKRVLGVGGMGEVVLAEDRDIGRNVAMKYLNAPHDPAALSRFVDEIRIVGSLEHPNIVPIHDVGVDDENRYYFVMKHVEGETLENVIDRLVAGDPTYHARYTFTARAELFIALLRALQFAHAHGYVHRDIKPANVMIGPYGEVVLMDWGVAKRCRTPDEATSAPLVDDVSKPIRERLFTTRRGAIVGTPAYMSPEQARGEVDKIDERSDVYCASVLFYELMTLTHYLGERENLTAMLRAIEMENPTPAQHTKTHPSQTSTPAEYLHFAIRGLQKDPAARFQSVEEMVDVLAAALDGRVKVQCPATFTKRVTRELGRFVDRRPMLAIRTFFGGALLILVLLVWSVFATLHMHG